MNEKEKYWYKQLDRFGLFFGGVFFGALAELTNIRTLGIIIGVAGMVCVGILMMVIKGERYAVCNSGEKRNDEGVKND